MGNDVQKLEHKANSVQYATEAQASNKQHANVHKVQMHINSTIHAKIFCKVSQNRTLRGNITERLLLADLAASMPLDHKSIPYSSQNR